MNENIQYHQMFNIHNEGFIRERHLHIWYLLCKFYLFEYAHA